MNKCRMCNTHLTEEDLLCDDEYCLSCINSSDGEDEEYGILHHLKTTDADIYLIKQKTHYIVDTITHHYRSETDTHMRSRHNSVESATELYLNLIRDHI